MKIKYNRVSTTVQSGNRFETDCNKYDLVLLDKISGTVNFFERPNGKKLLDLVNNNLVRTIVVEELSRLGRNHLDVLNTLNYFEKSNVNVEIRNLGISSMVNGKVNSIWKIVVSVLSTMYELEVENIKERTKAGREFFLAKGGKLGRPTFTNENLQTFLSKKKSKEILNQLSKKKPIRDIAKIVGCSTTTVLKVKKYSEKNSML